jgi:hypothetical protein
MIPTQARRLGAVLAVPAIALSVSACGGRPPVRCVELDASGSTAPAQVDYFEDLGTRVQTWAAQGDTVRIVVGAGQPMTEATPDSQDFSDTKGVENQALRQVRVDALLARVRRAIETAGAYDTKGGNAGSGIIAGITLVARDGCTSVVAYTDGLETADVDVYHDDILTVTGREALLDHLASVGMIATLDVAEVDLPFLGYVPSGSSLSKERKAALPAFYAAWIRRSGGTPTWHG